MSVSNVENQLLIIQCWKSCWLQLVVFSFESVKKLEIESVWRNNERVLVPDPGCSSPPFLLAFLPLVLPAKMIHLCFDFKSRRGMDDLYFVKWCSCKSRTNFFALENENYEQSGSPDSSLGVQRQTVYLETKPNHICKILTALRPKINPRNKN